MSLEKNIDLGISNYLKNNSTKKGVGLITDKQHVLYTEYNNTKDITHSEIMDELSKRIFKEDQERKLEYCISYFLTDNSIVIYIPNSITNNEYIIFTNLLDKIKNLKEIQIINDTYDFNKDLELKNLKNLVTNKNLFEEEIIGEELPINIQKENIKSNCELNNIKTNEHLERTILLCSHYYNDSYYKKYIEEIFPDFNLILENIKSVHINDKLLKLEIDNSLSNITNYDELFELIIKLLIESINIQIKEYDDLISKYEQLNDIRYNSNIQKYKDTKLRLQVNLNKLKNYNINKNKGFIH